MVSLSPQELPSEFLRFALLFFAHDKKLFAIVHPAEILKSSFLRSTCGAVLHSLWMLLLVQAFLLLPARGQLSVDVDISTSAATDLEAPAPAKSGPLQVGSWGFEPGRFGPEGSGYGRLDPLHSRRASFGQLPWWPESKARQAPTHGYIRHRHVRHGHLLGRASKAASLAKTNLETRKPGLQAGLSPPKALLSPGLPSEVPPEALGERSLRGNPFGLSVGAAWIGSAETTTRDQFGRALIGGAIGAGLGIPAGALLIREARDENSEFSEPNEGTNDETPEGLLRLGAGVLGAAFIGGGGPIGATQRLGDQPTDTYMASIAGNLLGAAVGLSILQLGDASDSREVLAFAVGIPLAAVGSAAGAALGAEENESRASARRP